MAKSGGFNLKEWRKKMRPGDFMRQLIIVILGIFITLTVTNFATGRSKKNEYRKIVRMVYDELVENKSAVDKMLDELAFERYAVRYLIPYRDDFGALPVDSMNKYMWAHLNTYSPSYTSNALEVLKYSSTISYTDDMHTVRDIMSGYELLKLTHDQLQFYWQEKWNFLERYSRELEDTDYWSILGHGPERLSIQYHTKALERYVFESLYDNIIEESRLYSERLGVIIARLGSKYRFR